MLNRSLKQKAMGTLIDFLFPRRCPVCDGVVAPFGSLVCEDCGDKMIRIEEPFCMKCGKSLREEEEEFCSDCRHLVHMYDRGRALCEYKNVADSLYRYKYMGRQEYAAYYAREIKVGLGSFITYCKADALIPVPIHNDKRRERGYNQSELLADALGKITNIPVYTDVIARTKKTAPLKDLSPLERQNNLKKAFKILRDDVKLNTIIIIDDIYTTGSTIDAMSTELRRIGIKKIYFLTLAVGRGC